MPDAGLPSFILEQPVGELFPAFSHVGTLTLRLTRNVLRSILSGKARHRYLLWLLILEPGLLTTQITVATLVTGYQFIEPVSVHDVEADAERHKTATPKCTASCSLRWWSPWPLRRCSRAEQLHRRNKLRHQLIY